MVNQTKIAIFNWAHDLKEKLATWNKVNAEKGPATLSNKTLSIIV